MSSRLELGCQSPRGRELSPRGSFFYPRIPLSLLLGAATLCPCPRSPLQGSFFCLVSVHACLCFACGVARSSVCPVPARRVFNNVRSVAFSRRNKGFLTILKDLSLKEPTQGNRSCSNIKGRGRKRLRDEKGRSDPTPETSFGYDGMGKKNRQSRKERQLNAETNKHFKSRCVSTKKRNAVSLGQ